MSGRQICLGLAMTVCSALLIAIVSIAFQLNRSVEIDASSGPATEAGDRASNATHQSDQPVLFRHSGGIAPLDSYTTSRKVADPKPPVNTKIMSLDSHSASNRTSRRNTTISNIPT
ncbi:MAG: hypothetical protein QF805_13915, partial [Pirellulaceae bacterium]|nr:hypothetical protein [Pirellulaceae bacterium]